MIFELFLSFCILSCIFIFLGYFVKPEIKVLAVLGFATLFFLGLLLQFNGVSIKEGETVVNRPACSQCGGNWTPIYENVTREICNETLEEQFVYLFNESTNRTEQYWINVTVCDWYNLTTTKFVGYENTVGSGNTTYIASSSLTYDYRIISDSISRWVGRWLAIVSVLGMILVFISNRTKEDDD